MKKILIISFSLIMALMFTACGNDSDIGYGSNTASEGKNNGMSKIESTTESAKDKLISGADSIADNMDAKISKDEAKAKALKHAGVEEKDISGYDIEIDKENGKVVYDIDFMSGGKEYSYTVDANSGDIIEHEHEQRDND